LGGEEVLTQKVKTLFDERFFNRNVILTDSTTAEFVKYMNNTYFATKISIMNEYYRLSQKLGVDWEIAKFGFVSDGRVADSHLHVPGPDGKLGFGGTCFPKDINALITIGKNLNSPMNVLEGAWKTNLEVRPEQDWNKLEGRAVTKK
jgi:UDPglucose 6-dehydrogenase